MKDSDLKKRLERSVLIRTEALAEKVLKGDTALQKKDLDELEEHKKLLDYYKAVSVGNERKTFLIALFLAILLLLTILLNKVNTTFVELDILASSVAIKKVSDKPLLMPSSVESITVFSKLKVLVPQGRKLRTYHTNNVTFRVPGVLMNNEQQASSQNKIEVILPEISTKDTIRMTSTPDQRVVSLSFCATHEPLSLRLRGDIVFVTDQQDEIQFSSSKVKTAELIILSQISGSSVCAEGVLVDLEMKPGKSSTLNFNSNIKIDSLSLLDDRLSEMRSKRDYSPMSTIEHGKLLFHELGGQKLEINRRQRIELGGVDGYLRSMSLERDGFSLLFEGNVKELNTGPQSNVFSLMPSYLEWITHRESLTLLWSSVLSLFGLVFGFFRWFSK